MSNLPFQSLGVNRAQMMMLGDGYIRRFRLAYKVPEELSTDEALDWIYQDRTIVRPMNRPPDRSLRRPVLELHMVCRHNLARLVGHRYLPPPIGGQCNNPLWARIMVRAMEIKAGLCDADFQLIAEKTPERSPSPEEAETGMRSRRLKRDESVVYGEATMEDLSSEERVAKEHKGSSSRKSSTPQGETDIPPRSSLSFDFPAPPTAFSSSSADEGENDGVEGGDEEGGENDREAGDADGDDREDLLNDDGDDNDGDDTPPDDATLTAAHAELVDLESRTCIELDEARGALSSALAEATLAHAELEEEIGLSQKLVELVTSITGVGFVNRLLKSLERGVKGQREWNPISMSDSDSFSDSGSDKDSIGSSEGSGSSFSTSSKDSSDEDRHGPGGEDNARFGIGGEHEGNKDGYHTERTELADSDNDGDVDGDCPDSDTRRRIRAAKYLDLRRQELHRRLLAGEGRVSELPSPERWTESLPDDEMRMESDEQPRSQSRKRAREEEEEDIDVDGFGSGCGSGSEQEQETISRRKRRRVGSTTAIPEMSVGGATSSLKRDFEECDADDEEESADDNENEDGIMKKNGRKKNKTNAKGKGRAVDIPSDEEDDEGNRGRAFKRPKLDGREGPDHSSGHLFRENSAAYLLTPESSGSRFGRNFAPRSGPSSMGLMSMQSSSISMDNGRTHYSPISSSAGSGNEDEEEESGQDEMSDRTQAEAQQLGDGNGQLYSRRAQPSAPSAPSAPAAVPAPGPSMMMVARRRNLQRGGTFVLDEDERNAVIEANEKRNRGE